MASNASLYVELLFYEEILMGQGLTRVIAAVLEDLYKPYVAKEEIKEMLAQTQDSCDSKITQEYLKVVIKPGLAGLVG
jgi:hypothetical protein